MEQKIKYKYIKIDDIIYKVNKLWHESFCGSSLNIKEKKEAILNHKDTIEDKQPVFYMDLTLDGIDYKVDKNYFQSINFKYSLENRNKLLLKHKDTIIVKTK